MRILVVSEFHILNTGYAAYYKNICQALHDAGHQVYELASYGNENLPEHVRAAESCPWYVYLNIPHQKSTNWALYKGAKKHRKDVEYGSWNFENTVLDCLPDVVLAIRDPWYDKFIVESTLSKYYSTILCPTVDSRPLKPDWISIYSKVDRLTSYTAWAEDWLKTQYGGANIVPHINAGIKPELKPLDKRYVRKHFGLNPNDKIVLTVMRNQGRKKFPELFEVVDQLKDKSIKLHCHTHFEDRGWDLVKLALQSNVLDRILFTYKCTECFDFSIDNFNKNKVCKKCNSRAKICSVDDGISNNELNYIYNNCDLYVQWHSNEGLGFPPIEAAAVGKRVITVNFSAQEDVVNKIGGIPVDPLTLQREIYSLRFMAIPDNTKLVELLDNPSVWEYDGQEIAKLTRSNYDWDKCGKEWVKLVESIKPKNIWNMKTPIVKPPTYESLEKLDNFDFIKACILLVGQCPEMIGTFEHAEYLDMLDSGYTLPVVNEQTGQKAQSHKVINKQEIYKKFISMLNRKIAWEEEKNRVLSLKLKK